MSALAVELPEALRPRFGQRTVMGSHRLQDHDLFTDAALVDLLDRFPREHLYAFSTGSDPTRVDENHPAHHEGVSGSELLKAVRNGRLWLNVTRVDRVDKTYRRLINDLYSALRKQIPGFSPDATQGTLLISSPGAQVYYHADGPASALWHIRGRKRLWVYPELDPRYMRRELLEDIFAGVRHEYLPYQSDYDDAAEVYDLQPGQWISWPQNAPHRLINHDCVNVSLNTEYFTEASRRRFQLYIANRFFRTRLGLRDLSLREDGALALGKIFVQRAAHRLGLNPLQFRCHVPTLRVAADATGGVVALDAKA
ncbi:MAG TPA: hypothetical protein VFY12_14440 [Arenimonas sp.]|nr:hypothetical protein [Arenimonas sp.]